MAKRKATRRVPSDEVQGEGSFVVLRAVKYKEVTEALREKSDLEREEQIRAILADCIVEWDWVDDDDQPLRVPQNAQEVGDLLYTHEVTWLTEKALGAVAETKN